MKVSQNSYTVFTMRVSSRSNRSTYREKASNIEKTSTTECLVRR